MDHAVLQYELLVITMYCQKSILLLEGTQVKKEKKKINNNNNNNYSNQGLLYIYIKVKNRTLE